MWEQEGGIWEHGRRANVSYVLYYYSRTLLFCGCDARGGAGCGCLNSGSDRFVALRLGPCLAVLLTAGGWPDPWVPRLGESSLEGGHARTIPRSEREDPSQAAAHPSRTPPERGRGRRELQRGARLRQQLRQLVGCWAAGRSPQALLPPGSGSSTA